MARRFAALAAQVLDTAKVRGADYADVQFWNIGQEQVFIRSGVVRGVGSAASAGYGIRALVDGSWGFAGSDKFDKASLDAAAARAVQIAKAAARVPARIRAITPTEKYDESFVTPHSIDPKSVSLSKKINDLLTAEKAVHVAKNIIGGYAFYSGWDTSKEFYSTIGTAVDQRLLQTGAGVTALAMGKDHDVQQRSGPGDFGLFQGAGYEVIQHCNFGNLAPVLGNEASQLADAPLFTSQTGTLVLHGSVLNLQMHESIGHPLELDRTLGWEANFSGVSWAKVGDVGTLRYGSEKMTVYSDNTLPLGFATVALDDDGVKPQRVTLIENGILRGFESSRDTAAQANLPRTASVRAQDFANIPIVRMGNIMLAPGEGTLEDIISETNDGVLMTGIRSWSIDDHRLNFQFGPQVAWEIKNGKRGRMFKKPTYTGITPQFWGFMDRVAGESEMVIYGTPNCGKGEPLQSGRTTHACSHARFQNVTMGVKLNA